MGDASYGQTSFLGGEISQWAQGDYNRPEYKISVAKSLNCYPTDEGAWARRPGFQFLGTTRNGEPGRVLPFDFAEATPYNMEFTDGYLRFWNGTSLVTSNDSEIVAGVSGASPAVFTIPQAVTWNTGDQVYFTFSDPAQAVTGQVLLNRQFTITVLTPTTFTVVDSITGAPVNGSSFTSQSVGLFLGPLGNGPVSGNPVSGSVAGTENLILFSVVVNHIVQIVTPYTVAGADWHSLRAVQGLDLSVLLHSQVPPQSLAVLTPPTSSTFADFEFSPASFEDGPYLDPPPNAIASVSALTGIIQVTVGYTAWASSTTYGVGVPVTYSGQDYLSVVNGNIGHTPSSSPAQWQALAPGLSVSPNGFVATDVGRMIRLFSAPPEWSSATTYAEGATVTYNGEYFTSLANSNTNNEPDISLTDWVINPSGAIYSWGTITQVLTPNTVLMQLRGGNLLYTTPCPSFQIGAWSDTTGWPTCGCYQEGRFWYAGAIPNRFDTSQPDDPFNMAPTEPDGTVTDSSGISYTLNADSVNPIFWLIPDDQGILIGTQESEWLASSGTSTGQIPPPMTATNIVVHRKTKYGCANILPVKSGLSICFVQRFARRMLELLVDVFSGKLYGPDLTKYARHLGKRTFVELAYQQELVPIVWGRMGDGSLTGITYRRVSQFSTQPPEFMGWHQHSLGSGRVVESICVGPANDADYVGSLDALAMVTNDPATNIRFVESSTTLNDENDPLFQAFFLDAAVAPGAASLSGNSVTFYGLSYLNGRTVSVWAAAVDCGDYIVENGQVTVPLGTVDPVTGYTFDIPQFKIVETYAAQFLDHSTTIVGSGVNYTIPCVIGFNYATQGQLCRPALPIDTGAKNGPGFAKKKKTSRYGINLVNSLGVQVGSDPTFQTMFPVPMASPMGKTLPYLSAFSGIKRETLSNDFSFDSMICWQTTRPYPTKLSIVNE